MRHSASPVVSSCGIVSLRRKGELEDLGKHILTLSRRSVAEIDELFLRKVPAWRWANFKTAAEAQLSDALAANDGRYGQTAATLA